MAYIITITGAVGGTGKTTLAANLATLFAAHWGQKVVCLDLGSNTDLAVWFHLAAPVTAADFSPAALEKAAAQWSPHAWPGGLQAQGAGVAPIQQVSERLALISNERGKPAWALSCLAALRAVYDFIVIDATHAWDETIAQGTAQANLVLLSGGLRPHEPHHLPALAARLKQVGSGQRQQIRTVLHERVERDLPTEPARAAAEIARCRAYYEEAYQQNGLPPLCATRIRADEAYEEALCEGQPVVHSRPPSRTLEDYLALSVELLPWLSSV